MPIMKHFASQCPSYLCKRIGGSTLTESLLTSRRWCSTSHPTNAGKGEGSGDGKPWAEAATTSAALASESLVATTHANRFDVSFSTETSLPASKAFLKESAAGFNYMSTDKPVKSSSSEEDLTPEMVLAALRREKQLNSQATPPDDLPKSLASQLSSSSNQELIKKAIDMPKILFFGGDQVAVACLSGLCDRMLERLESLAGASNRARSSTDAHTSTKDYSILAPFLEIVCPQAPPLSELEGSNSAFRHTNFPIPRFCHKHGLTCHIVNHRNSLIKSGLNFDEILEGKSTGSVGQRALEVAQTEAAFAEMYPATRAAEVSTAKPSAAVVNANCTPLSSAAPRCAFDVAVVVSFRYFIPDALLTKLPPVINLHPSLLPKYRGCSPIFSTMLRGDAVGGASLIKIRAGEAMDSGDVLMQRQVEIIVDDDMRVYFPKLMALGAAMLGDALLPTATPAYTSSAIQPLTAVGTAVQATPHRPLPWRSHFDKLWFSAVEQPDKIHFKLDPNYAPMIPRRRATHIGWENISGLEAYNQWRTFVGGQFFGAVSACLERRATPVAEQLLARAISKYNKKQRPPRHPKLHHQKGEQRAAGDNGPPETEPVVPITVQPSPGVIDSLMQTHVTFNEARHPGKISAATYELLDRVSSGAMLPGAACFPSTDEGVVAIMCGKRSLTGTSSHAPEAEWFFPTELMLEGSKGATTPKLLRTSLAMKVDTIYPFLFVSEKSPWTLTQQQIKSQGRSG